MAELTVFGFRPGESFLHQFDVRMKIACMVLVSLSISRGTAMVLMSLTLLIGMAFFHAKVSIRNSFHQLRCFFPLLLLVFLARAATFGNTTIPVDTLFGILRISPQGLADGAVICWRLVLIVLTGIVFTATTRPFEIKTAVRWYLVPLPFVPQDRVATMLSLVVRFVPRLFLRASETMDAQRARCVENRKNPVYRLRSFAIPFIRKAFLDADNLALAMEARCFQEERTMPQKAAAPRDWIVLLITSILFLFFF